jgi:hypothetical protein
MKTKFFLVLLTLNGLILGANSASASTVAPTETSHNIATLSQTIAKLIDVDAQSLVELAIDRALTAQSIRDRRIADSSDLSNSTPTGGAAIEPNNSPPIINGKIAAPRHRRTIDRPIINGIIIKDRPHTQPTVDDKPIINGVVINRDRH